MSDQIWVCDGCNTNNAAEATVCRRCRREPGSTTAADNRLASDVAVTPRQQDTESPDTTRHSLTPEADSATALSPTRSSIPDSTPATMPAPAPEGRSSGPVESATPVQPGGGTLVLIGVLAIPVLAALVALIVMLGVTTSENHPGTTTTAPTSSSPATPSASGRTAYDVLEAESFDWQSGGIDVHHDGYIGQLSRGDSIRFTNVDFGSDPAAEVTAHLWTTIGEKANAKIEIRLDRPAAGRLIGKIDVSAKNRAKWKEVPVKLINGPVTGNHTVYLTFASDSPNSSMYLDWIRFHH